MTSKGFTLLETTIVLGISVFLLLLGFFFSPQTSTQIREEQFIQNLTSEVDKVVLKGKEEHRIVRIFFGKSRVEVRCGDFQNILEYPKTLYKYGAKSVYISPSGVTQPVTISLVCKDRHYSYDLTFELSFGGVYRVSKRQWES